MNYSFLTKNLLDKLLNNGSPENTEKDHIPVLKLFTPDARATWLLTELLPSEPNIAFGLCDLGLGFPELGYVDLRELATVKGKMGLPVERDTSFEGKYPLSVYTMAAVFKNNITEDTGLLEHMATVSGMSKSNSPKPE